MNIQHFTLGPLGTNCYILHQANKAIIIDPGEEGPKVINWLTANNLEPIAILLTHAHFDHIGAVDLLRKHYSIKVYMHKKEKTWLKNPNLNGSLLFIQEEVKTGEPDELVEEGILSIDCFSFEIMHTPGHSPGSISYKVVEENMVFSGDVLFHRGIGRTDLPGGDFNEIQNSIRNKLYQLPDDTVVYPGHGPVTTIGGEKIRNPFVPEK